MEQQADGVSRYLTLDEVYDEPVQDRLAQALSAAGYSGLLGWQEIDGILVMAERHQYLASRMWWAIYISLGGKCPCCGRSHPSRRAR